MIPRRDRDVSEHLRYPEFCEGSQSALTIRERKGERVCFVRIRKFADRKLVKKNLRLHDAGRIGNANFTDLMKKNPPFRSAKIGG